MPWIKEGDLSRLYPPPARGSRLNCNCDYQNSASTNVTSLLLCGYNDGSYQISAKAPTGASYTRLAEEMLRAGFPNPDVIDKVLKYVTLITSDRTLIASFLLAVKEVAPELAEIEQDVCQSLGVDLTRNSVVPSWHRTGDFTRINDYGPGAVLNREVSYRTGQAGVVTNEFRLLGYQDRGCIFQMNLIGEASAPLRQALIESGLPLQFSDNNENVKFCFSPTTIHYFDRLLSIISQHNPHFAEICDSFKQHVAPVITAPVAVTRPRAVFFQADPAPAARVSSTRNDLKLAEINFNDDDIPDEYRCSLSLAIMTEPVYAKGLEQYQFDKSWILRHLATAKNHPFTRQPLEQGDLIANDRLKEEITTFVDNAIRQHEEQRAPGNTST